MRAYCGPKFCARSFSGFFFFFGNFQNTPTIATIETHLLLLLFIPSLQMKPLRLREVRKLLQYHRVTMTKLGQSPVLSGSFHSLSAGSRVLNAESAPPLPHEYAQDCCPYVCLLLISSPVAFSHSHDLLYPPCLYL